MKKVKLSNEYDDYEVFGNNIIVDLDKPESYIQERTRGGIIIPGIGAKGMDSGVEYKDHPFQGEVILVGPGCKQAKVGDRVLLRFPLVWRSPEAQLPIAGDEAGKLHINPVGQRIYIGEKEYRFINENEVLGFKKGLKKVIR